MSARCIIIGGFPGSGKTTAIQTFSRYLAEKHFNVGLITNDRAEGQADSAIWRSIQLSGEKNFEDCFGFHFYELTDAERTTIRPEVLLAELLGSGTDLVATVSQPFQKLYGIDGTMAPLSVLIDPIRAVTVLDPASGKSFSESVTYLYRKQIEEADFIVINKVDSIDVQAQGELRKMLEKEFPDSKIFEISARSGEGCAAWFESVLHGERNMSQFLDMDSRRCREGETLLGWLRAAVHLKLSDRGNSSVEFDGNELLEDLARRIQNSLELAGDELAHLKITLSPLGQSLPWAAIHLVSRDAEPEFSHQLDAPLEEGELLFNLCAEMDLENMTQVFEAALIEEVAVNRGLMFRIEPMKSLPSNLHRSPHIVPKNS